MHGAQHVAERGGVARHLEPHVEAFLHAELFHRVVELLLRDVDGARRAHLLREPQPVIVDVGDDHVARADLLRDGHRHDADGAGAGDQHVFAHHVEGEGGVRGVAEGIEDAGDVVGDGVGQLEGVARRNGEVLREAALAIHAHAHGVEAQVAPAGAAVAADSRR